MKIRDILQKGEESLRFAGIDEYKSDAFVLFEYVFGIDRTQYFIKSLDEEEDSSKLDRYFELINLRCLHKPVQYITNRQMFMGLEFYVDENVLIPRFDTEILVENVLDIIGKRYFDKSHSDKSYSDKYQSEKNHFGREISVLDMCTGSGCIAISIAKLADIKNITAVDISDGAIEVAKKNSKKNNVDINFVKSDLFDCLDGKVFDIIVSNPPYIRTEVVSSLMEEVRSFEPMMALDGTEDGLFFYRKITKESVSHMNTGGYLAYEIGFDQGNDVKQILIDNGFIDVEIIKDLAGLDRVVIGRLAGNQ